MTSKGEKINLVISIISSISLIIAHVLNYFRTEWFGIIKGYAPHNFGFNVTYFFPLTFLSFLTAFISTLWLISKWKARQNRIFKWTTLGLILPAVIFFFILVGRIFQMMRTHY